jgi:DNA polymerase III subunit delta'
MNAPWPWQQAVWHQLVVQIEQRRLPHALLLQGMPGLGQRHFAQLCVQRLLCLQLSEGLPCQVCSACLQVNQGSHPDYLWIEREEKARQLKIEQIRAAVLFVQSTAAGWRIVVIDEAETMNINAQNALLKNLEEPGSAVLFILISYRSLGLLPTVRSRCQTLTLLPAQPQQVVNWWQHYQAPLDAHNWDYFSGNGVAVQGAAVQDGAAQDVDTDAAHRDQGVTRDDAAVEEMTRLLRQAHGAPLIAWQMRAPGRQVAYQQLSTALSGLRARTQGVASVVDLLSHWPIAEALQALLTMTQQRLLQALSPGSVSMEAPRFLCQFYQRLLANWQRCQHGVAMNERLLWEELILCFAQQNA